MTRDPLLPEVKCAIKAKVVHNDGTGRAVRGLSSTRLAVVEKN